MSNIPLSQRLKTIAHMVSPGNTVADVGCDHGFLSIYLVLMDIAPEVIATDLREGPLQAAETHVTEYGLTDRIQIRLSDGLEAVSPGEADTVILAGMGGKLMLGILERGGAVLNRTKELILQPQSDIPLVRGFFREQGLSPAEEEIIFEEGKYYFPMKFELRGKQPNWSYIPEEETTEDRYGPLLLLKKHSLLNNWLNKERLRLLNILEQLKKTGDTHREKQEETAKLLEEVEDLVRNIESQDR